MEFVNDTGQDIILVLGRDGVVYGVEIPKDYTAKILSPSAIMRNKMYKELTSKRIQGKFVKMFVATKQLADKFSDYNEAFRAIAYIVDYIQPNTNILMHGDRKWQKGDLAVDMGVKRQTAYRYIDKMVEERLLRQITLIGKGKVWVANPYYFENGEDTIEAVINAFPKPPKIEKKDEKKEGESK